MTGELKGYYETVEEDLNNFTNEELENIKQICNIIIHKRKEKEIEKLTEELKEIANKLLVYDVDIYYCDEIINNPDYFEFRY